MSIWAKWNAWAKWGEGGGAAPTYKISGTAGMDGVTVTLTGDASDSVVTSGGGLYEFSGLAPGSYTVTPTLTNYTFAPTSTNVTIVAADQTGKDFVASYDQPVPIILNFEGATIGDTGAELELLDTYDILRDEAVVRADDYDTMNAYVGTPALTQCLANPGNSLNPYAQFNVAAGKGFLPSAGGYMIFEVMCNLYGTGSVITFDILDATRQEGIHTEMYGNSYWYVRTRHLGVNTGNLIGPYGISRNPHDNKWHTAAFMYNLTTDQCYVRLYPYHASWTDTGWVEIGDLTGGKTYDQTTEWTFFSAVVGSNTTATQGIGQVWVNDVAWTRSEGVKTHNYKNPA